MKKIVLIDDDRQICEVLQTLLEEDGFCVMIANDGITGLEIIRTSLPDLIICDIMMDGIDGFEVYLRLLSEICTRTIPFIFLTAKAEKEDLRKGLSLGADDFLFKPFVYEELLNSINIRLKKNEDIKASVLDKSENSRSVFSRKCFDIEDNVLINSCGNAYLVKICDIKYISSENQYSSVHINDGKNYLTRKSVSNWEEELPVKYFIRIHRSSIINLEYISKIEKLSSSSFLISIRDEKKPLIVSKRYATKIRDIIL